MDEHLVPVVVVRRRAVKRRHTAPGFSMPAHSLGQQPGRGVRGDAAIQQSGRRDPVFGQLGKVDRVCATKAHIDGAVRVLRHRVGSAAGLDPDDGVEHLSIH